jgi:signal transduction histidine kinase
MNGFKNPDPGNYTLKYADEYNLLLRGMLIATSVIFALFGGFNAENQVPYPIALGLVIGINLMIALYEWHRRPFANGFSRIIFVIDAVQASLATLLVGGHLSIFFPLFILLVVELAIALPVRYAVAWILSASALQVTAAVLNQIGNWTTMGASITVAKLFILLFIGLLALAFSERIRREEQSRLAAEEHATQLTTLNERLQEFEQTRESFLSAIAHELCTPLTVLKTLMPSMAESNQALDAHRDDIQDMVEQNLSRLETLISDFLESTRLASKAVILHRQPLEIAQRTAQALAHLKPLFMTKQQVVLNKTSGPTYVYADRHRVDQILSSLLHNANKFTPAGGIISIEVCTTDHSARICIEDNGPGITPAARDHLFDRFYSASAESALAGVGLGLYICHELVSLHGGNIWYEDRPGGGSRFLFNLPLAGEAQDGESRKKYTDH